MKSCLGLALCEVVFFDQFVDDYDDESFDSEEDEIIPRYEDEDEDVEMIENALGGEEEVEADEEVEAEPEEKEEPVVAAAVRPIFFRLILTGYFRKEKLYLQVAQKGLS